MNTMSTRTKNLVLGGILIALGTALSFVKVFDLPYGGSITLCSMLPVMLFSYRCGFKWGIFGAFTFSVLQLLFGLNALKGLSVATLIGSIALDYLVAFTVLGLCGMFRGKIKKDAVAFTLGVIVTGLLRYACSFLSGWILWSQFMEVSDMQAFAPMLVGMSGNTLAALYSLLYNGSYMLPEILLTGIAAFFIMQFAKKQILGNTAA